ncbi:hypothetical protein [Caballeronia sordidicola]|uniref:hypothetical protein n=1 Tax=Caballeronia sordidicola TaxID=196367 RepID=UPI0012FE2C70|nr:hypothetical protein [Caballeronia sordidicola]
MTTPERCETSTGNQRTQCEAPWTVACERNAACSPVRIARWIRATINPTLSIKQSPCLFVAITHSDAHVYNRAGRRAVCDTSVPMKVRKYETASELFEDRRQHVDICIFNRSQRRHWCDGERSGTGTATPFARLTACGNHPKVRSSHAIVMPGAPAWQSRRGTRQARRAIASKTPV